MKKRICRQVRQSRAQPVKLARKNLKSSNPKGSLPQAGGRGVRGEFRPPYKFWAKSVRIFSNAHRQLGNVFVGSSSARARQPFFLEISSQACKRSPRSPKR